MSHNPNVISERWEAILIHFYIMKQWCSQHVWLLVKFSTWKSFSTWNKWAAVNVAMQRNALAHICLSGLALMILSGVILRNSPSWSGSAHWIAKTAILHFLKVGIIFVRDNRGSFTSMENPCPTIFDSFIILDGKEQVLISIRLFLL